jgi:beta-xylosidase
MLNLFLFVASIFFVASTASPIPPAALSVDFADPSIIRVAGTWYAFATSSRGFHVQVAVSENFDRWARVEIDVLPFLPAWVEPGTDIWAPDVIRRVSYSSQCENNTFVECKYLGRR